MKITSMKYCLLVLSFVTSFTTAEPEKTIRGHVFAWPFLKTAEMQPHGGTTKGTKVTLTKGTSSQWQALQETFPSNFQRDRLAILAMTGSYRASFDFMETMGFTENYHPPKPYFSWGTEHIHILKAEEKFISLQHTLVMYFKDEEGKELGPMVMKHWRQDWTYEDTNLHVYQGKSTWAQTTKPADAVLGHWTQAVFQVDDSPRYEVTGKWSHREVSPPGKVIPAGDHYHVGSLQSVVTMRFYRAHMKSQSPPRAGYTFNVTKKSH